VTGRVGISTCSANARTERIVNILTKNWPTKRDLCLMWYDFLLCLIKYSATFRIYSLLLLIYFVKLISCALTVNCFICFYLPVSLLAIRLPSFSKLELSWVIIWKWLLNGLSLLYIVSNLEMTNKRIKVPQERHPTTVSFHSHSSLSLYCMTCDRFYQLGETRVILGTRNSSVLSTPNRGLFSE